MSDRLTLLRPDDWHIHLRDGAVLPHTVGDVARTFARAIIMPNLVPPVRNAEQAGAYRERILAARPAGSRISDLTLLRTGKPIDVSAPLPPHMAQSWNLLGFDAARYDPIVDAPEA